MNTILSDDLYVLFSDASSTGEPVTKITIAEAFDETKVYSRGELCWHEGHLVQANVNTGPGYDSTKWSSVRISDAIAPAKTHKIISNEEYVYAIVDENDTVLFAITTDGSVEFYKGFPTGLYPTLTNILQNYIEKNPDYSLVDKTFADALSHENNEEYIYTIVDTNKAILFAIKQDGSIEFPKGFPTGLYEELNNILEGYVEKVPDKTLIENDVANALSYTTNDEFAAITKDENDTLINSITKDGEHHFYTDVNFDNCNLKFTEKSITSLEYALSSHGFSSKAPIDWSDATSIKISKPKLAIVNISGVSQMPSAKGTDANAYMEFWDMNGNFFKKKIILDAQGSGSLRFPKKNFAFDLCNDNWIGDDTFEMKIGDWVVQDSFHGKAFWNDYFRGVANIGFDIYNDINSTYDMENNTTWKKAQIANDYENYPLGGFISEDDLYNRMDYNAKCFPNGFPMLVYLNNEFYGIFTWNLKKHRDNYHMKKSNTEHIHIDPTSTKSIWNSVSYDSIDWTQIEIRNPKDLIDMDGKKYDGDNPKELIDSSSPYYDSSNKKHKNTAKVKQHIIDLRTHFAAIMNCMQSSPRDTTTATSLMNQYFDFDNLLDYQLFMDWIQDPDGLDKNWQWTTWDGNKWFVNPYDLDTIMGNGNNGTMARIPMEGMNIFSQYGPTWVAKELKMSTMRKRYADLRNKGVFDKEKIKSAIKEMYNVFTPDDWENEWNKWNTCPVNLPLIVNSDYWELDTDANGYPIMNRTATNEYNSETSYTVGDRIDIHESSSINWYYSLTCKADCTGQNPITQWGQYDSFWRLCKWADLNQTLRDSQYNYNP